MQIEIITQPNCSFCVAAKNFLRMKNMDYVEKKVGVDLTKEDILNKFPGVRTVPIISIDEKFIGGYTDLVDHFKNE